MDRMPPHKGKLRISTLETLPEAAEQNLDIEVSNGFHVDSLIAQRSGKGPKWTTTPIRSLWAEQTDIADLCFTSPSEIMSITSSNPRLGSQAEAILFRSIRQIESTRKFRRNIRGLQHPWQARLASCWPRVSRSSTKPSGGLKPPPERRFRGSHLQYSMDAAFYSLRS